MKIKHYFLFGIAMLLPAMSVLIQSCHKINCEYEETYCSSVRTIWLTAKDNSGIREAPVKNNEVLAKALLLDLDIVKKSELCSRTSAFDMAAMAYTCNKLKYADTVVSMKISSNAAFNNELLVGADLSSVFKLPSLSDLNSEYNAKDSNSIYGGSYKLYLMYEPADTGTHIFTIELTLANGTSYKASTEPIKLLRAI